MKKMLSAFVLIFTLISIKTSCEVPTQQTKNILNQHGLQYGRVNHLGSIAAFDAAITSGAQVFVKIGASWCSPCKMLEPILEQLASEFIDVLFIEINFDSFKSLANRYGVRNIPTIILFKNNVQINRLVGFKDKHYWINVIQNQFN